MLRVASRLCFLPFLCFLSPRTISFLVLPGTVLIFGVTLGFINALDKICMFLLDAYSRLGYSGSDLRYRHYHDLPCYFSVFRCDADREQCRASQLLRFHLFSVDRDFEWSVATESENISPG